MTVRRDLQEPILGVWEGARLALIDVHRYHFNQLVACLKPTVLANRLEGFELDEEVNALYQRYIDGELTLAAVGSAIDELDDREFGPVSLCRHKDPQEPARSH